MHVFNRQVANTSQVNGLLVESIMAIIVLPLMLHKVWQLPNTLWISSTMVLVVRSHLQYGLTIVQRYRAPTRAIERPPTKLILRRLAFRISPNSIRRIALLSLFFSSATGVNVTPHQSGDVMLVDKSVNTNTQSHMIMHTVTYLEIQLVTKFVEGICMSLFVCSGELVRCFITQYFVDFFFTSLYMLQFLLVIARWSVLYRSLYAAVDDNVRMLMLIQVSINASDM